MLGDKKHSQGRGCWKETGGEEGGTADSKSLPGGEEGLRNREATMHRHTETWVSTLAVATLRGKSFWNWVPHVPLPQFEQCHLHAVKCSPGVHSLLTLLACS